MNCPKCGEVCSCSMEPAIIDGPLEQPNRAAGSPDATLSALPGSANDNGAWRDELSSRLSRYRARRKAPPPRYPSLRLPFERVDAAIAASAAIERVSTPSFEPASNNALALDGMRSIPAGEPDLIPEVTMPAAPPLPVKQVAASPTAKIIEFPRFAWAPPPPPPDQLAEPVLDRPRILEVPEVVPPPPALGGITIERVEVAEPEKRLGIDVPLQSAGLSRRMIAATVDGLIVGAAAALFGFIFWKVSGTRPPRMQMLGVAGGLLFLFWSAYQYLLLVHSGRTPGIVLARLELVRFDGSQARRSLRRWRVLASYLSAVSLGMGYIWVFLDEDSLCWHDRITRTYLAPIHSAKSGNAQS